MKPTNSITFIPNETMAKIKENIENELCKRGFHAPIELEYDLKKKMIVLDSEKFNTTPVIFKSIELVNFGGSVRFETTPENEDGFHFIWIPVYVSYKHFDMGENGCKLFDFSCKITKDLTHIYSVKIN